MKFYVLAVLSMAACVFAQDDLRSAIDDGDLAAARKMVKKGQVEEIYCGKLTPKEAVSIYGTIFKKMPDESFEQCPSQYSYGYGTKVCANPKGLKSCTDVLNFLFSEAESGNVAAFDALGKVVKVALANKTFKKPIKEKVDTTMWVPCKKKGKARQECIEACEAYAEEIGDEERLATCKKKPAEYKETQITVSRPSEFQAMVKDSLFAGYWHSPKSYAIKFANLIKANKKVLSIPDSSVIDIKYVRRWAENHKADSSALPGSELFRFCTEWQPTVDSILESLEFDVRCPVFGTFVDNRDGKSYKVRDIEGKSWFVQNLNYAMEKGSMCYDREDGNCDAYGRLYMQEAAKVACPPGSHLATDEEWKALEEVAGGASSAAVKLRSNGSDDYAFTALFGGYANKNGISTTIGEGAYFWTEKDEDEKRGVARSMFSTDEEISTISVDSEFFLSVRCVKDDAP